MKIKIGVLVCLIFFAASLVYSSSHYQYVYSPKSEIYFGHISFADIKHDGKDPVVLREGVDLPEVAVINFPLAPGDTIRTTKSRRCEIQFDTGTLIRLDYDTELKIETIMAQSLSSRNKITNIVLNQGEIYIMYKRYNVPEFFQVLTQNAAMKLSHNTVATLFFSEEGKTVIQVKEGKITALYGPEEKRLDKEVIKEPDQLTITPDHRLSSEKIRPDVEFKMWNKSMNRDFELMHEGQSFIPKPILKYPKAVYYFAQKYSNIHGEWIWDDLYGYVWRPHYNDRYPWGNWQPYTYGQWTELNGHLFWVPEEKWGWIPYHLGVWTWNKKLGWLWIPGSAFAPSWAVWDFYGSMYAWRPWIIWDWYFYSAYQSPNNFFYPMYSMYSAEEVYPEHEGGYVSPGDSASGKRRPLTKISKDQLEKGQSVPHSLPKDMKKLLKNVVLAIENGDQRILDSLRDMPDPVVLVSRDDLNADKIQERSRRLEGFSPEKMKEFVKQRASKDPYRSAVYAFKNNRIVSSISRNIMLRELKGAVKRPAGKSVDRGAIDLQSRGSEDRAFRRSDTIDREISSGTVERAAKTAKSTSTLRFRDLNPDVRIARRSGVSIKYSSRTNEIQCPQRRLTSSNVSFREGRSLKRSFTSSSNSKKSSSSSGGSGVSSSSSSSGSSKSTSSSSSQKSSSSRGSSGKSSGSSSGKKIK